MTEVEENHYRDLEGKMDHASGAAMKLQDKEKMRWLYFYLIALYHLFFLFTVLRQRSEFDSSHPSFLPLKSVCVCL